MDNTVAESKKKVLYITVSPAPYRVCFFRLLAKKYDLTVVFNAAPAQSYRMTEWYDLDFTGFRAVIPKKHIGPVNFDILKVLKEKFDTIILADYSTPTGMLASWYLNRRRIPYDMEADGARKGTGKGIKEKFKKRIISRSGICFSSSKETDEYYLFYGKKREEIVRYPFTSLLNEDVLEKPLSAQEKQRLKDELGLKEEKILISVGRFSYKNGYGKGFDTLLRICEKLPDSIGVYIIGDEPTEEFVRWKEEKRLDHLHYLPFKPKEELFRYYQAADLSVFLSRGEAWGLVVNESMANALPVVTTDACVAGLELIENGKNGYIVPVDSAEMTREIILDYLQDAAKQERFSRAALETIRSYTIENMADIHAARLSQ